MPPTCSIARVACTMNGKALPGHGGAAGFKKAVRKAVAGEGGNPCLPAALHHGVVIGLLVQQMAVVGLHGPDGGGKDGQGELLPKQGTGGIHRLHGADGVHVQENLLPGLIVAAGHGAGALGPGAGNGVFTTGAVTHGTGLAGAHIPPGGGQNFLIGQSDHILK